MELTYGIAKAGKMFSIYGSENRIEQSSTKSLVFPRNERKKYITAQFFHTHCSFFGGGGDN